MSICVDDKNIYGSLRLVKYAWFLIENYYELHDSYCNAAGQAILRYVLGDKSQSELISMLENEFKKRQVIKTCRELVEGDGFESRILSFI